MGIRSLTVGQVTISGLDSVKIGGRVTATVSDVTLVLVTSSPDDEARSSATPEQLSAARRTLLEVLSALPWLFPESGADLPDRFVQKVLGGEAAFKKGLASIRHADGNVYAWPTSVGAW